MHRQARRPGRGNKRRGNFFLTETQRAQSFFDRIDRINRIENFYRIERKERKERREKIVQSMNPILKILFILSKKTFRAFRVFRGKKEVEVIDKPTARGTGNKRGSHF